MQFFKPVDEKGTTTSNPSVNQDQEVQYDDPCICSHPAIPAVGGAAGGFYIGTNVGIVIDSWFLASFIGVGSGVLLGLLLYGIYKSCTPTEENQNYTAPTEPAIETETAPLLQP